MFNNCQVSALGSLSAFCPPGLNSSAYSNLLSGTSGLTGMNFNLPGATGLAAGGDQVNLGSEAAGMMGGDSITSFIMQMISKLTASSNAVSSQLLSGSGSATATTGAGADSSTAGTGSAATAGSTGASGGLKLTSDGKLDTTGIQNSSTPYQGGQHITSGTVNNTMGTAEITPEYVRADGLPSAAGDGAYKVQAGPVFENKCPCCGKKGSLIYERVPGTNGATTCPEGAFICSSCDADFSIISGKKHIAGSKDCLTKVDTSKAATGSTAAASSSTTGTAAGTGAGTASAGATAAAGSSSTASSNTTGTATAAGAAGGTGAAAVAAGLAKEFATYTYQSYSDFKKSDAQTESSKSGNCGDMAQLAVAKFKAQGINARLVGGNMKNDHYNGGHYWVQYQDPATGEWKFFDPTPAAITKKTDVALAKTYGTYSGENVFTEQMQSNLSS